MVSDLRRILVTAEQIRERVRTLGQEVSAAYTESDDFVLVGVINGAITFLADLMREIERPMRVDSVRVASYSEDTYPRKVPEIIDRIRLDVRGADLLVIDDIIDTGKTFSHLAMELRKLQPRSLRLCVLLEKQGRREIHYKADFVGFTIPDEFVVGYGLDFAEKYRNLPCIGVPKPELLNPPEWR